MFGGGDSCVSQLSVPADRVLKMSWRDPGRLPALRALNWNSVYLTADTLHLPVCGFLILF